MSRPPWSARGGSPDALPGGDGCARPRSARRPGSCTGGRDAAPPPHLFHPHGIAVEGVAACPQGHVELEIFVGRVREGLAHVVVDAGAAQYRPRAAVAERGLCGEDRPPLPPPPPRAAPARSGCP